MPAVQNVKINGIDCAIKIDGDASDSVVESQSWGEGPRAVVRLTCPWNSRYAVLKGLAGSSTLAGKQIVRTAPFQYPPSRNLYCTEIASITAIGKPQPDTNLGWITFADATGSGGTKAKAVITAVFTVPKWQFTTDPANGQNDPSGQAWTTTRFKVSAEVFTPGSTTFKWQTGAASTGNVTSSNIGIIRPRTEISLTRHWMPYIPLDYVQTTCVGNLNLNPITFSDHTYPKGAILFASMNSTETADTLGNIVQEVEYIMLANGNDVDWNKLLDVDGNYYFINTKTDQSGNYPYGYADWYTSLP
jgi:hypothetical protein